MTFNKLLMTTSSLLLITTLTACSLTPKSSSSETTRYSPAPALDALQSIANLPDKNKIVAIQIPSRGGLADGIMITSLKAGKTIATTKDIVQLLKTNEKIALTGNNPKLNIAVLESALNQLNNNSKSVVYIKASVEDLRALQTKASSKGVTIKSF